MRLLLFLLILTLSLTAHALEFPSNVVMNLVDSLSLYAKHFREFFITFSSAGEEVSYFKNVIFGELMIPMSLLFVLSSLVGFIVHVVSLGSKEKVFRIYASSVVTLVENIKSILNLSTSKLIRKPVSVYHAITVIELAISNRGKVSGPVPTARRLLNLFPESRDSLFWCKHLVPLLLFTSVAQGQSFFKGPALIESIYEFTPGPTIPMTAAFNTIIHGTGSGTQTITLPDATTLTVGRRFAFDNGLSGNITVQDVGANTLFTVLPGQNIVARLYNNGSANGSWYIEQNAINLANNLQALGTLPVGSGGTGSTSFAADSIPYSNGTILTENNTGFNYNLTNERLTINADGASAAAPPTNTRLHLIGNNGSPSRLVSDVYNGSNVQGPYFLGRRARGTAASPAAVQNGDVLSAFAGTGYGTTAFDAANGSAIVSLKAQGTWTDTSAPSYIQLFTTPSASTTAVQRLKVDSTGSVVVGNNSSALATNATDGFLYISSSAGIPTGVPTAQTGSLPIHIDSTNSELYFYSGSWLKAISGTATVPEGGTGATSFTDRGVLIGRGTAAIEATGAGSAGQVLQSGGAGANPSYSTATYPSTAGNSGSVLVSGGTNFTSTNIDLADSDAVGATILGVANGGTGQSTYTNGQLLIGNTTGNTLTKATLTAGNGVVITNGGGSITIGQTSGTYTPSNSGCPANTNVDSVTFQVTRYYRVGNMVTVSGFMSVDPTTTLVDINVYFNAPIASAFTTTGQNSGNCNIASTDSQVYCAMSNEATNDCLRLLTNTAATASRSFFFQSTYEVF